MLLARSTARWSTSSTSEAALPVTAPPGSGAAPLPRGGARRAGAGGADRHVLPPGARLRARRLWRRSRNVSDRARRQQVAGRGEHLVDGDEQQVRVGLGPVRVAGAVAVP